MKPHLHVSWEECAELSYTLASRIYPGEPRAIIAVTRGGLFPAQILSHALNIKLVDTICVESYTDEEAHTVRFLKFHHDTIGVLATRQDPILVVDDICDTGRTFAQVRTLLPHAHYMSLYVKPEGLRYVDTSIVQVPQDIWVVFPWETQTK